VGSGRIRPNESRSVGSLRVRLGRRLGCVDLALPPAVVLPWRDEPEKVAVLADRVREAVRLRVLVHG
jgi:hypothetical protein